MLLLAKTGWPTLWGHLRERERTWRPDRPPRSSSHKVCVSVCVCVCFSSALLMTDCLCGVRQDLKRYWTSHGTVTQAPTTHPHTHPGAPKPSYSLFICLWNAAGGNHTGKIWKCCWWVVRSESHPSLKSSRMRFYCSSPLFITYILYLSHSPKYWFHHCIKYKQKWSDPGTRVIQLLHW